MLPRGGRGLAEPAEVARHVRLVVIPARDRDVCQWLSAGDPAQRRLEADGARERLGRDADVHLEAPFELTQAEARARGERPQIDRARSGRDGPDGGVDLKGGQAADDGAEPLCEQGDPRAIAGRKRQPLAQGAGRAEQISRSTTRPVISAALQRTTARAAAGRSRIAATPARPRWPMQIGASIWPTIIEAGWRSMRPPG